jgi:hypothetical protein
MVGCGSEHIYRAFNSDINALERALKERMLYYKDMVSISLYSPLVRKHSQLRQNISYGNSKFYLPGPTQLLWTTLCVHLAVRKGEDMR